MSLSVDIVERGGFRAASFKLPIPAKSPLRTDVIAPPASDIGVSAVGWLRGHPFAPYRSAVRSRRDPRIIAALRRRWLKCADHIARPTRSHTKRNDTNRLAVLPRSKHEHDRLRRSPRHEPAGTENVAAALFCGARPCHSHDVATHLSPGTIAFVTPFTACAGSEVLQLGSQPRPSRHSFWSMAGVPSSGSHACFRGRS
jgi:hypothetical protein